jgi:Protein of unknown function (DUF4038)/Putative collagen-binding domain of a collagenase
MKRMKYFFATLAMAGFLANPLRSPGAPVYPLKPSANGRYLVDQTNAPCLIIGESPQGLIANLSTNEAALFFANRSAHGFNTVWINLLCATYTGGRADASTFDGIVPFTGNVPSTSSYDLTKTNEAYFARVDQMINLAAQVGIQVLLDPCETGSFVLQTSTMLDNGTNRCRAYGQFLGNRYKNFPNIIWMSGNDFQTWRNAADDAVVRAVALGIKDTDTNHLHTAELDYLVSSSLDDTNWNSILGLNATYTYFPTYARLQQDYNRPNFLPNFLVEANYEFESLQGPVTTAPILRKQEYWTMTCGVAGQMYGNGFTWPLNGDWQNHLDTPGAIQIGYLKAFFEARTWFDLVPDTNRVVVTAGYGTFSDSGHVADNDYLTAARTSDGSLVVIYTPIIRQFTVDMSQLSGLAAAHWFDPAGGIYFPISGSPFTNSGTLNFTPAGNNVDGDGGWVLVLETNPPAMPPPPPPPPPQPKFVQQSFATPQSPQSQVSVAYANAQIAGEANILAIGWNDDTNSITAISDTAGNVYHVAIPTYRGNGTSQAIYYATNINAGNNTVTATFDHPAAYADLRITEYSGLSPTNVFDVGSASTGIGTAASSGPVTVITTNELLFAAGMTAGTFTGAGSGFTLRVITSPDSDMVADQIATATGNYNATATLSSSAWLLQLAAFRAASFTVPALRIVLTATNTVVIAWPASSAGFALQQNSTLTSTHWTSVTNALTVVGGENQVVVLPSATAQFYRLKSP